MSGDTGGAPERLGRLLGKAVVRGQTAARQVVDPTTREQIAKAGRRLAEQASPKVQQAATRAREELVARGPDVAEQATQRAVDRAFWVVGARAGFLAFAIRPLAAPVRQAAGTLARDLAKAAGSSAGSASTSAGDDAPPPLPETEEEAGSDGGEPPAPE